MFVSRRCWARGRVGLAGVFDPRACWTRGRVGLAGVFDSRACSTRGRVRLAGVFDSRAFRLAGVFDSRAKMIADYNIVSYNSIIIVDIPIQTKPGQTYCLSTGIRLRAPFLIQ